MVRLKECQRNEQNRMRIYFNSTMVRLKEQIQAHWNVNVRFQFHYGTIKSTCTRVHVHM